MPVETLDDIIQELADLLEIYGEERSHWESMMAVRLKKAVKVEALHEYYNEWLNGKTSIE